MDSVDCVVIGAGVVGLAVASKIASTGREVVVVERHDLIGSETSSRNSEVIHAGIYYPTGSLKAHLCVRGKTLLYEYCEERKIPYLNCGKVIVASNESQIKTVVGYIEKARLNGVVDLEWIEEDQLNELEPNVSGVGAVMSPSTGIIDSHAYMLSLQGDLERNGGVISFSTNVIEIRNAPKPIIVTPEFELSTPWVINCGGLDAPLLSKGLENAPNAYFAKGHYYSYLGSQPFSRLVYPVAEEGGLGVHVTLDLAGQVKFGPDVRWIDSIDYSFDDSHKADFISAIRSYFPSVEEDRLQPSYTGIRPKLAPEGSAASDFVFFGPEQHGVKGRIDLLGIESPGLTSSLAIGEEVVNMMSL